MKTIIETTGAMIVGVCGLATIALVIHAVAGLI
jgi:hypothetical protein